MESMEKTVSIAEEIRRNREKGAERLVTEYRDRLYAAAFSLCGDASKSEDLVFRTFEQVIEKISSYREDEAFYRWMYTILLNYYRKSVRGRLAKNLVPMGGLDELESIADGLPAHMRLGETERPSLRRGVSRIQHTSGSHE